MKLDEIRYFMEALPDASLLINSNGSILGANRHASDKLRYSPDALMNLTIEDLVPERLRKNHESLRNSFAMSKQQRSMGGHGSKYFPARLADGQEIMAEISIGRLSIEDEESQLLLVIIIDRTDKVKFEEKLLKRANVDQLTELYTRAYFLELLEREIQRAKRNETILSLIFFDIDHFKDINDKYGHYIGDLVLRQVGNACKQALRNIDIFGRLGGEEFVVALPDTNIDTAVKVSERLRLAIKDIKVPEKDNIVTVTASFGITDIQSEDTDYHAPLKRADKALYRAKSSGRDKIEVELSISGQDPELGESL